MSLDSPSQEASLVLPGARASEIRQAGLGLRDDPSFGKVSQLRSCLLIGVRNVRGATRRLATGAPRASYALGDSDHHADGALWGSVCSHGSRRIVVLLVALVRRPRLFAFGVVSR